MWQRETETVEGVLAWNRAKDLDDFEAAMRLVTWNENTGYADADGRIAFWHPGLHHARHPGTDLRLPVPGTGEYDLGDHLPFEALPHAIDPAQGYLSNWNNKPAHGWLDGVGMSYDSYPAGRGHRVTNVNDIIESRDDWTFEALRELDRYAAERDMRATEFLPLLLDLQQRDGLGEVQRAALDVLAAWDGSANGAGADMEHEVGETATVGAAPTIFEAVLDALVDDLLGPIDVEAYDLLGRQLRTGRHVYDVHPALNLLLRVLEPTASTLEPSRDYLRGRAADDVLAAALGTALTELGVSQPDEVEDLRRDYRMERVCSPTGGVVGPCLEMPFIERGTWIHMTGFSAADTGGDGEEDRPARGPDRDRGPADRPGRTPPGGPPGPGGSPAVAPASTALPATGGGLAALGLVTLLGAALLRRR
jgi:penicillin G amidase